MITSLQSQAANLARTKHAEQRYNEMPYEYHLARVASFFSYPHLYAAGWLHDIVEDTDVTVEDIRELFGPKIADIVDHLSRRPTEFYSDYMDRLLQSTEATMIKWVDMTDNLRYSILQPEGRLSARYFHYLPMLAGHARDAFAAWQVGGRAP